MNTDFPHLDLTDLISEATGQEAGDRMLEHLASCADCRAEVDRWNLVAAGVRDLAVAAPELAPPARPRGHGRADPGRRTALAAGAAAALVVLGGAGYGAAAALTGHPAATAGTGDGAVFLTAVQGCAGLKLATGTLVQVNGDRLVIETPSGRPVTVTTGASTMISISGAPPSDITDGAPVIVMGATSDGAMAADTVTVGQTKSLIGGGGAAPARGIIVRTPPSEAIPEPMLPDKDDTVQGTVADAGPGGFTVVTSDGRRVQVTTSGRTFVSVLHGRPAELRVGATTLAAGYLAPDRTLSATAVLQLRSKKLSSGRPQGTVMVNGCSPASIDSALTAAFASA